MSRRARYLLIFTVALCAFAAFVWPTFWTYGSERQGLKAGGFIDVPVRYHRITGQKQSRVGDEWSDGSVLFD